MQSDAPVLSHPQAAPRREWGTLLDLKSIAPGRPPDSIVNLYNELKLANPPEIRSALTSSNHGAGDLANQPSK